MTAQQRAVPVINGMDPHKCSATIEVLDARVHMLFGQRFETGTDGYRAMLAAVRDWPARTWAVEGANGAWRYLAQRLLADGEQVLDVPAKLSAQVRGFETGHGRKTDATDAHSIAAVAVRRRKRREGTPGGPNAGLRVMTVDDEGVELRLLADRRHELGVRRTEITNRIHRLLGELIGGGAKRFLIAAQAKKLLDGLTPEGPAALVRAQLVAELVDELAGIGVEIKAANRQLQQLVTASGSHLMDLYGIGPFSAARLLGDVGDIARLLRRPDTAGRAFFDRKRGEGKSTMEALRALKRRLSHVVYRQMLADADDRMSSAQPDHTSGLDAEAVAAEPAMKSGSALVLAATSTGRLGERGVGDGSGRASGRAPAKSVSPSAEGF